MLGLHAMEGVTGWSSLAPAGNGGMKGASQIVVRQDESGTWIAEDRHSFEYAQPSMDEQQDVQLLFAQQDDETGATSWGVVIPQNSCDAPFDYAIEQKDMPMLWAFGDEHDFFYHKGSNRGQFTANLMAAPPVVPDLTAYPSIDLVMPNVEVVRGEPELDPKNPFICSYFDLQELGKDQGFGADDKIQMVGYEPIIQEGNEEYIHHLTLFTCEGFDDGQGGTFGFDQSNLEHNLVIPACTNMPPGCNGLFVAWAIGADPPIYPENVGFPIGEGAKWLVMQMHYFNPNLDKDVYDSSGVKLHYTTDLRPIDAGLMSFTSAAVTGQQPPLPGGMKDVTTDTMFVEPDCTNTWDQDLNVLSVFHHSHFMGLKQEIVVEREGVNMGPMRTEYRYDYNHQGTLEPMNALRTLKRGDRMAATCHFDTSEVSSDLVVEIGEESDKEMCFQGVFYYPKQQAGTGFSYGNVDDASTYSMADPAWCSSPPTIEAFGSQCAEQLYTNVTGFYRRFLTEVLGYDGPDFDMPTFCNGGEDYDPIKNFLPICPDDGCQETGTCSDELIGGWAYGVCEYNCGTLGLSLYPDESKTELFNSITYGCPSFFNAPTLAKPEACKARGSLPLTNIELSKPEVEIKPDTEPANSDKAENVTDGGGTDPITSDKPEVDESTSSANGPGLVLDFMAALGFLALYYCV